MKSEYVFPSPTDKNKPVGKQNINLKVSYLSKKVLGRKIHSYVIRHSRANEVYQNVPEKIGAKFMGHSAKMGDFYTHLSSKNIKEAMLKSVYNLEELPPEKKTELEKKMEIMQKKIEFFEKFFQGGNWDKIEVKDTKYPKGLRKKKKIPSAMGMMGGKIEFTK